jgi:membrane protein DedA with SNARE-associated domain
MDATIHNIIAQYGPLGLTVLLMFGIVGLPVPDETLLTGAGVLIRTGELTPIPTAGAALLGSMSGITISFLLGVYVGTRLIERYGAWLHVSPERFARFQQWYDKYGRWTLLFGYFVPGLRHVLAIAAGVSELRWHQFAMFAYTGAVMWVSTFLVGGYYLGQEWLSGSSRAHWIMAIIGGALALIGIAYLIIRRWRRNRARHTHG